MLAQARMEQVLPNCRCWATSFFSASRLVPGPQLEQDPSKFSLQTSQLIPQAPVGIVHLAHIKTQVQLFLTKFKAITTG
jgi:hypothetical protein